MNVIKGTKLNDWYNHGEYEPMTFDDYIDTVANQIATLPKRIVIERVTGDGDRRSLVAPLWILHKRHVINSINKYMELHNLIQGDFFYEKYD